VGLVVSVTAVALPACVESLSGAGVRCHIPLPGAIGYHRTLTPQRTNHRVETKDRTLALAGVFQAAQLVRQLAHDGRADNDAFGASIDSILKLEAASTAAVFGGGRGVRAGLEFLRDKFADADETINADVVRYVVAMLHLSGRLQRRPLAQQAIREGIATIERQMKFFEPDEETVHPNLVEKLAELYVRTLSTLAPRVIVTGEHGYLVNPLIAAKVRAALFAGIRAAFLWRQLGGRRWHLLLSRRRTARDARTLLDELRGN
jgi:high frequency lysogenization protein